MLRRFMNWLRESAYLLVNWLDVLFQLLYGLWKLTLMPCPRVTIFGGARLSQADDYSKAAVKLASMLSVKNIAVLTGGGPGIMEAANKGASLPDNGKCCHSMGIMVTDLLGEQVNHWCEVKVTLKYFFARKWLLTRYSNAFVFFPGGFGTLDELMEVLTLIHTKKIKRVPVFLFGKEYWQPLLNWLCSETNKHGLVEKSEINFMQLTDSFDEVVNGLSSHCDINKI